MLYFLILGIFISLHAEAFNVDDKFPIQFPQPTESRYFGYTVAFLSNTEGKWLVVGAPSANSTYAGREDIVEPGEIYKCNIDSSSSQTCKPIDFENGQSGNGNNNVGKNNAWLGVSLDISDDHEQLVACGHLEKDSHYETIGVCYRKDKLQVIKLNMEGQKGLSAQFLKNSTSVMVTSVDKVVSSSEVLFENNAELRWKDSIPYSYFGYALASGNIFSQEEIQVVSGAPRARYRGNVYIEQGVDKPYKTTLSGSQLGEYFGAALCAVDLDNDGLDELLVGAPFYSKDCDEGKVYIYKGSKTRQLLIQREIIGADISARFGSSIAAIGDLDLDGFQVRYIAAQFMQNLEQTIKNKMAPYLKAFTREEQRSVIGFSVLKGMKPSEIYSEMLGVYDLAIGAPYENNGKGAVYIYHGSLHGLNIKHIQKIMASGTTRGFGISIAGQIDIDDNNYSDIAIGAYVSGEVFIFRTRPVANVTATLKANKDIIDVDGGGCTKDNKSPSCFILEMCFKTQIPIEIIQTLELDTLLLDGVTKRVYMEGSKTRTFSISDKSCEQIYIYAPVRFKTKCKDRCNADLKVKAWIPGFKNTSLVIGSTNQLFMKVNVSNSGDAAYITSLTIDIPYWMTADNIPTNCHKRSPLSCDVANILETGKSSMLEFTLNVEKAPIIEEGNFTIICKAFSQSEEQNDKDNQFQVIMPIRSVSDIYISGSTNEEQIFYKRNKANFTDEDSIVFSHVYRVGNNGPTALNTTLGFQLVHPTVIGDSDTPIIQISLNSSVPVECDGKFTYHYIGVQEMNLHDVVPQPSTIRHASRRDTKHVSEMSNDTQEEAPANVAILNCNSGKCEQAKCTIDPLVKDTSVILSVSISVRLKELAEYMREKDADAVVIVTEAQLYRDQQEEQFQSAKVMTEIKPGGMPPTPPVATWIIVVSVMGGLIALSIVIGILIKLGFFKRPKKEEMKRLTRCIDSLIEVTDFSS